MNRDMFEQLVAEVLDSLPEKFGGKLQNVAIVVEDWPNTHHLLAGKVKPGMTLFGLYEGVPQTKRGQYMAVLPDKISIFAGPILMAAGQNMNEIRKQIQSTVLHEIGHHFGMSEKEIREAQGDTTPV
jgi:predicted Zn-dependent protease with MMP-like domain